MRFRATVELNGKTATGIEVPAEVVAELGSGKRPPVTATLNGHFYRTMVGSMGGRFLIPVSVQVRQDAGVAAGDVLDVEVELDEAPRTVAVPDDLAAALAADAAAGAAFARMSTATSSSMSWPSRAPRPRRPGSAGSPRRSLT